LFHHSCFTQDVDVYKQVIRTQIKKWLDLVTGSKHAQEWLIVYVSTEGSGVVGGGKSAVPSSTASAMNPKNLLRTNMMDKIRSDFNSGKRDRHDTRS
jgi:hypothetical protein